MSLTPTELKSWERGFWERQARLEEAESTADKSSPNKIGPSTPTYTRRWLYSMLSSIGNATPEADQTRLAFLLWLCLSPQFADAECWDSFLRSEIIALLCDFPVADRRLHLLLSLTNSGSPAAIERFKDGLRKHADEALESLPWPITAIAGLPEDAQAKDLIPLFDQKERVN